MKELMKSKEEDSWNQFLTTGKVEDYLKYVNLQNPLNKTDEKEGRLEGVDFCAEYRTGDRYYTETDTYR